MPVLDCFHIHGKDKKGNATAAQAAISEMMDAASTGSIMEDLNITTPSGKTLEGVENVVLIGLEDLAKDFAEIARNCMPVRPYHRESTSSRRADRYEAEETNSRKRDCLPQGSAHWKTGCPVTRVRS